MLAIAGSGELGFSGTAGGSDPSFGDLARELQESMDKALADTFLHAVGLN